MRPYSELPPVVTGATRKVGQAAVDAMALWKAEYVLQTQREVVQQQQRKPQRAWRSDTSPIVCPTREAP